MRTLWNRWRCKRRIETVTRGDLIAGRLVEDVIQRPKFVTITYADGRERSYPRGKRVPVTAGAFKIGAGGS